jgi:hypothetical protein
MIAVLTVISSMDPHTIRVTSIGMVEMLGWLVSLFFLGRTAAVDFVVGSMSRFVENR